MKPYNPLPHKALGLYVFLYVYGIEIADCKYHHEIVTNTLKYPHEIVAGT